MKHHSPLPWNNPSDSVSVFTGKGEDRQKVCDTQWTTIKPDEARANANLIVRAVNSHADLVAALQFVLKFHEMRLEKQTGDHLPNQLANTVRQALAKATDKTIS